MKKVFCIFMLMAVFAGTVVALSNPRWDKRPIKVYIPDSSYKSQWMKAAFQEWQAETNAAVWFVFLGDNKKDESDIDVYFEEFVHCNDTMAIGCTHNKSKNGFYTHSDIEIGSKYVIELKGDDGTVAKKTMEVSQKALYGTMLHEIGHAIGIQEHSNDINSIMYSHSMLDHNIPQHLTQEDLRLIYKTYR